MMDMHRPELNVRLLIAPELEAMEQHRGIQATAKSHQQLAIR